MEDGMKSIAKGSFLLCFLASGICKAGTKANLLACSRRKNWFL